MNDRYTGRNEPKERVTLKKIAEDLGVSPMTVSNAYNRPTQLSPAMRERVFETARRMGYTGPDPTARGLRRGRSGAIGVVYDSRLSYAFADPAAIAFLRGVSAAAEEAGRGLLLVPGTPGEQRDPAGIGAAMVDGVVVYSVTEGDPVLLAALDRNLPTVVVDQPRVNGTTFVGIDDRGAARAAAVHVLDLGHRRCSVVSFGLARDGQSGFATMERQQSSRYQVSRARLTGYADALASSGIGWSEVSVFECQGSSRELGREAAWAILAKPDPPTTILALSDELALGVIEAANERGLAVPDDLSVVGFDDIPEAAQNQPPLTTVSQDHAGKGYRAGQLLIAHLQGEETDPPELLTSRLVVRGSTAPPNRAPERVV